MTAPRLRYRVVRLTVVRGRIIDEHLAAFAHIGLARRFAIDEAEHLRARRCGDTISIRVGSHALYQYRPSRDGVTWLHIPMQR